MDAAFLPFNEMLDKILDIDGELYTPDNGIHSYVYELDLTTPIELDILVDENGKVSLGIIPPLYRVETSFRPSYHSLTFTAEKYQQ
jgi:hypothetical protein